MVRVTGSSPTHLEGKEGEDHEAEDGEGHHLGQLLHRMQQRVDNRFQP